jgi:hypothetical protein
VGEEHAFGLARHERTFSLLTLSSTIRNQPYLILGGKRFGTWVPYFDYGRNRIASSSGGRRPPCSERAKGGASWIGTRAGEIRLAVARRQRMFAGGKKVFAATKGFRVPLSNDVPPHRKKNRTTTVRPEGGAPLLPCVPPLLFLPCDTPCCGFASIRPTLTLPILLRKSPPCERSRKRERIGSETTMATPSTAAGAGGAPTSLNGADPQQQQQAAMLTQTLLAAFRAGAFLFAAFLLRPRRRCCCNVVTFSSCVFRDGSPRGKK